MVAAFFISFAGTGPAPAFSRLPGWLQAQVAREQMDGWLVAFAEELAPDAARLRFANDMHQRLATWLQGG